MGKTSISGAFSVDDFYYQELSVSTIFTRDELLSLRMKMNPMHCLRNLKSPTWDRNLQQVYHRSTFRRCRSKPASPRDCTPYPFDNSNNKERLGWELPE